MSPSFPAILLRLVENGFAQEALGAASACRAAYWDELLWDHLVHVRSRKQYSFASAPRSRTRVMEAASRGRMDRLSWLLERRASQSLVSNIDIFGRSALFYALLANHAVCAGLLVMSGACLFTPDCDEKTPVELIYARAAGPDLASKATDAVLSNRYRTSQWEMQLMLKLAFMHGHMGCVASLVGAGLKLDNRVKSDNFPLWCDSLSDMRDHVFLSHKGPESVFSCFFRESFAPMLRTIINAARARGDIITIPLHAVEIACLLSNEEAVDLLLGSKFLPINFWRDSSERVFRSAFSGLSRRKYGSIVQRLVEAGAHAVIKDAASSEQPLWYAMNSLSPEGVRVLINAGAMSTIKDLVGEKIVSDMMYDRNWRIQIAEESDVVEFLRLCIDFKLFEGPAKAEYMTKLLGDVCYLGYLSCVRMLLDAGGSPAANGMTFPLRQACESGHENAAIIQLLLAHGACDKNRDGPGLCLKRAAENHHTQIVRVLLESGSSLYTPKKFTRALNYVLKKNGDASLEIVRLLIDAWEVSVGGKEELDLSEPLNGACRCGRADVVAYILDRIATPTNNFLAVALEQACYDSDAEACLSIVKMLLSHPRAVFDNKALSMALIMCCQHPCIDCIETLLEASDERHGHCAELIVPACFSNLFRIGVSDPVEALSLLLDRVTDYDTSVGRKVFLDACSHGSYRCVEALLQVWRPPIEEMDDDLIPVSLLQEACISSNGKILQLLLDHGYGDREKHVRSALFEACSNCNVEAVRTLLNLETLKLTEFKGGDKLVELVLNFDIHEYEDALNDDAHLVLELLRAHGLEFKEGFLDDNRFVKLCKTWNFQCLNVLLSWSRKCPRAKTIAKVIEIIFDPRYQYSIRDCDIIDTIATLRAAGADIDRLFVGLCARKKSRFHVRSHLLVLLLSGVNVDAHKKDKPVIYLLAANHYGPVLVSLMLQGGARFDEEALIKCVPRAQKDELRLLIVRFGRASSRV